MESSEIPAQLASTQAIAPVAALLQEFKPRWHQRLGVRFGLFLWLTSLLILLLVKLMFLSYDYFALGQRLGQGALRAPTLAAAARFASDWDTASPATLAERLRLLRFELEDSRANWLGSGNTALFELSPEPIRLTLNHPRRGVLLAEPELESPVPIGTRYWQTQAWVNQDRAALSIRVQLVPPYLRVLNLLSVEWLKIAFALALLIMASMIYLRIRIMRRLQRIGKTAAQWARARFSEPIVDARLDELGLLARQLNGMALDLRTRLDVSSELAAIAERERLGQELHDSVKQQAFALELQLGAMRAAMAKFAPLAQPLADNPPPNLANDSGDAGKKALLSTQNALQEASLLSVELRRDLEKVLNQLQLSNQNSIRASFMDRLREHADIFTRRSNIAVRFFGLLDHEPVPEAQIELLRIVDEALANIARHSGASSVQIDLAQLAELCSLSISDNGVGLAASLSSSESSHMGLSNMQQRASRLQGGTFKIDSKAGNGTTVEIRWQRSAY